MRQKSFMFYESAPDQTAIREKAISILQKLIKENLIEDISFSFLEENETLINNIIDNFGIPQFDNSDLPQNENKNS